MPDARDEQKMLADLLSMSEADAQANALADAEAPPLTSADFDSRIQLSSIPNATLLERFRTACKESSKKSLTVRYDADIVEWYRAKGKGYQSFMNAALRAVMEAEKQSIAH